MISQDGGCAGEGRTKMQSSFDADTALRRVDENLFEGEIRPNWSVGRGPNGGYVAVLLLRALMDTVADAERAPRSLTIHYLLPPREGPYRIETTVERAGRSMTSLSARLEQGGRPYALALAAFSTGRQSIALTDASMPNVPPPDACPRLPRGFSPPAFTGNYDYRWAVGDPPFSNSAHARLGGWIRLAEERRADALAIAAYTDAWMPCIFPRVREPIGAPTIDLTIHFRTRLPIATAAPDDYYLGVYSSKLAAEGFFEEDSEIWSKDGVLVAQSRQLALLPEG